MFKWAFWGVAGCALLSCGSGLAAQEIRPLAVILAKPARTVPDSPWQHESPPARVIGTEQSAPLGQVLLPNTLEAYADGRAEIWLVSDEERGETFQHPVTDPEVVAILKNRLQTRDYISCVKRWFSSFRRERIALEPGVQVSDSHWDLAVATFMGAR